MKILMIGLEGVDPEVLFSDKRLENLHHLMDYGCYGKLSTASVASNTLAWISLLTGQKPETLSLQDIPLIQTNNWPKEIEDLCLWREIERNGKKSLLVWKAIKVEGPQLITNETIYTFNQEVFARAYDLLSSEEWDYFQLIDSGLDQMQTLVNNHDLDARALSDYYAYLDQQISGLFEILTDETVVLVVSPAGVSNQQDCDGCFILAFSNNPLSGEISDVDRVEIAPTLLELGGCEIPDRMQGKSLVAGKAMDLLNSGDLSSEEEDILRERLSGLGYIS